MPLIYNNNNNIYSSIALISSSTGTCSVRCIKLHMFKTMKIKNNIHNNNKHNDDKDRDITHKRENNG